MTHTPGPWKPSLFNIVTDVTGIIKEKRGDTKLQVDKGLLEILDDNESTVAFVNLEDTSLSEKDLANAILIGAAPELLQALQFALERLEEVARERHYDYKTFDSDANDLAIDNARAAIAKATGEQHAS